MTCRLRPSNGIPLHPSLAVFAAHQPGDDPTILSRRSHGRELPGHQLLFWQVLPLEGPFLRLVVSEVRREAKFEGRRAGSPRL
jgi:hypothetical protein